MKFRIIDNNGMWSNWHTKRYDAMCELRRQRAYDNAIYTYFLQIHDGYEWITVRKFDGEGEQE